MFSFRDATGSSVSSNRHILTRTKDILLIKEGNDVVGFGFTIQTIQVGDRLLSINGQE